MVEIIPAIMPQSYKDLEKKIELVLGSVKSVQIDLMDGKYTNGKTWPFSDIAGHDWQDILAEVHGMPHWEALDYELDLMINDVPKYWQDLVRIGPKRIIFHFPTGPAKVEELKNFIKNLDTYYKYEIELGVAYENGTNEQDILDIVDDIKFVQCMGIDHVGVQGAGFDQTVFQRIEWTKNNLPDFSISVDGGVNLNTIRSLKDAGVSRFIAGSAVYNTETPSFAVHDLMEALEE